MRPKNMKLAFLKTRTLLAALVAVAVQSVVAHAAASGITGVAGNPIFNLTAQPSYITQPDGQSVYSWGYGCSSTPSWDAHPQTRAKFSATMPTASTASDSAKSASMHGEALIPST